MPSSDRTDGGRANGRLLKPLSLLWLGGMGMRIAVMAVPPVIPLIRADLQMSETQVGLLIGLPLVMWALVAVPGSLLIAQLGATRALAIGLLVTALAGAGRGAASSVGLLYLATVLMGGGIAVVQPSIPTLVREWLPRQAGVGAAAATNGILFGAMLGPTFTIPLLLPLVGQSWRLDLALWSLPVLVASLLFLLTAQHRAGAAGAGADERRRWWPNWRDPLVWLLGGTFGSNNALYFATSAFLPDYLASLGRADLIGIALSAVTISQLVASTVLLVTAARLQRRAWPYLVFGIPALAGVFGMVLGSGWEIVVSAVCVGVGLAITFVVTLALPAMLSPPEAVHRLSAAMFAVSYSIAVIVPIVCGALWDATGQPWTAFIPMGVCAAALIVLGVALTRHAK